MGRQLDALPHSLQAVRGITCAWKAGSAGHCIQAMCTVGAMCTVCLASALHVAMLCPLCTGPAWGAPLSPSLPPAFPLPNTRILPRMPRRAVGQQVAAECSFGRGWVCTWDSARKGAERLSETWWLHQWSSVGGRVNSAMPGCSPCWQMDMPDPRGMATNLLGANFQNQSLPGPVCGPFHELRTPPPAPAPPTHTCRA